MLFTDIRDFFVEVSICPAFLRDLQDAYFQLIEI